ncbi:MAG: hypothetical protein ACR2K2_03955 [Mycobacteriales bacterium]
MTGGEAPDEAAKRVGGEEPEAKKLPLYPRLLRLRHIRPTVWQRALLGEGALGLAILLVLADLATAWTLLVLPVAVAVVVKAHDGLAGVLQQAGAGPPVPPAGGKPERPRATGGKPERPRATGGRPERPRSTGATPAGARPFPAIATPKPSSRKLSARKPAPPKL